MREKDQGRYNVLQGEDCGGMDGACGCHTRPVISDAAGLARLVGGREALVERAASKKLSATGAGWVDDATQGLGALLRTFIFSSQPQKARSTQPESNPKIPPYLTHPSRHLQPLH